jgi:autotransporter-associated beta strand protein
VNQFALFWIQKSPARTAMMVVAALLAGLTATFTCSAQNDYLFSTGSAWLTSGNWSPSGPPGPNDIAQFDTAEPTSSGAQVNFSNPVNNGTLNEAVGAIQVFSTRTAALPIGGGSSAATSGVLTLNGAPVNSVADVVIENASSQTLTIENVGKGGNAANTMGLALANTTQNIISQDGSGAAGITISDVISSSSGTTPLTFTGSGSGTIAITGNANTFTGNISITGSEVDIGGDGSLGNSANTISINGGRLGITSGTSVTIASGRPIYVGSAPGTSISAPGAAGVLTYNGVIADLSTGGVLVKQGKGTLALGGVSTYSGNTTNNNGTIQLTTGNNRLPIGTVFYMGSTANTCALDLAGHNQQIAGLNSQAATANTVTNSSATPATLTISGSGSATYGGATPGVIAGAVNLVVNGSIDQTLGGLNTYTGSTVISNTATLALNGTGSISGSLSITIAGGATFDVSALTAALTLGNSQTLTAGGNNGSVATINTATSAGLALGATGNLQFSDYDGATPPLTVAGAGSLTLAAGNVVTVTVPGSPLTANGGDGSGNYLLVSTGGGNTTAVNGTVPGAVVVNGAGGLAANSSASLVISNSELYLHVTSAATAPSIATQPSSVTNLVNTSAAFSVAVSGTSPFYYFWQKTNSASGGFTNLVDGGTISGSRTAEFTNSSVQAKDGGAYRVVITNIVNAVTSSVVTLTVLDPAIIAQPASLTNSIGLTATFTVAAVGNSLSYQWYDGSAILDNGNNISGATSNSLTLSNLTTNSAGGYTVVVTDSGGSVTSSVAMLTIAPPFTPGNLAVLRLGDGAAALSSSGTAEFVDEYTTAGSLVQSIALPTSGTNAFVDSGSATSDGGMTRSADGSLICVPGYNANVGTASITSSSSTAAPRAAATLNANGIFTLAATTTLQFNANNIRSATTDGTNNFWGVGGSSGLYYFGTDAAPATVESTLANSRVINIINGSLYFSSGAGGGLGIYSVAGLPTNSTAVVTNIALPAGASPYGFAINSNGTVAYIADEITGISKWTNNNDGAGWGPAYTFDPTSTASRGLAVDWSGSDPVVYATTTNASANSVISIDDSGAGSTAATVATAGSNEVFRGVTFTPESVSVVPPLLVSILSVHGSTATFSSSAQPNVNYSVEYKVHLSDSTWLVLTNLTAAGTSFGFQDPSATNASRFYRILANQ